MITDDPSKSTKPKVKTPLAIEKEIINIFTRNIFFIFQNELFNVTMYSLNQRYVLDGINFLKLINWKRVKGKASK